MTSTPTANRPNAAENLEERLARLRIARTQGIGPVTYRKLMRMHENALDTCMRWDSIDAKLPALAKESDVLRELEFLERAGGVMLMHGDENYPSQLAELPDAPLTLSVLGAADTLAKRQVAIVGNRSASANGLTWAKNLAAQIAHNNVVLTSGLARGIDTAAHEGAIAAQGLTIAVVAGGVDHIYPPENAKLRELIMNNGCVVSEQAWGMMPTAHLFPRRNRIIAGLSIGVVVSEATRHSGSLITAECALNYGREVWAVPGSPADPRSAGPNWLLKNGATLIENAEDVLRDLPQTAAPFAARMPPQGDLFAAPALPCAEAAEVQDGDGDELTQVQKVFGLLGMQGVAFDELVRQTGLDEAGLSGVLVELELDGHAARERDGRWRRT